MNFENEVDYRLAKMLLANISYDKILTEQKKDRLWQAIQGYYNPSVVVNLFCNIYG